MQLNDRACFHFRSLALHDHFSEISDWSVFWQPYTHWEKNPSYFLIKTCLQSIPSWKISLEPVDYISPYWEIPAMLPNFFHSHSLKIIKKYSNTRLTPLYFFHTTERWRRVIQTPIQESRYQLHYKNINSCTLFQTDTITRPFFVCVPNLTQFLPRLEKQQPYNRAKQPYRLTRLLHRSAMHMIKCKDQS